MDVDLVVDGYLFHEDKVLLIHHRSSDMWLPVGGHIDDNETPDQALRREFKEEVKVEVEILGKKDLPLEYPNKENLATPFHSDLHNVGDHDHSCLYYACKPKEKPEIKVDEDEIKDYEWFSKEEIKETSKLSETGRAIALEAFKTVKDLNQ